MKILMIMNDNSYVGREYLSCLRKNNISIDVAAIGSFPEIDQIELQRCGNHWLPTDQKDLISFHSFNYFDSLNSHEFINFLILNKFDLAVQGGTGILRNNVIDKFKLGILNFHPGHLPNYRGCSAPEWQIYEGNKIFSTCHLIDAGIDTGEILKIKELLVDKTSYETLRGSIYPQTAEFLCEILKKIILKNSLYFKLIKQDESHARYLKYIGKEKIDLLKKQLKIKK